MKFYGDDVNNWHNVMANAYGVPLIYKESTRTALLARALVDDADVDANVTNENMARVVVVGLLNAAKDDHERFEGVVAGIEHDHTLIASLEEVEQERSFRTETRDLLARCFLKRIHAYLQDNPRDTGHVEHH